MALTSSRTRAEDSGPYVCASCGPFPPSNVTQGSARIAVLLPGRWNQSALCCGHRSDLAACVKRKRVFLHFLRCSQICQSERQALAVFCVRVKSLSSKPAALRHRTSFHQEFSGGGKH